jgi:hypothetical protein
MGRLTGNEACRISQCMLRCYRTRMNVRCDGAAGSVLTVCLSFDFNSNLLRKA